MSKRSHSSTMDTLLRPTAPSVLLPLLLLLILFLLCSPCSADDLLVSSCDGKANYTANSTYWSNLKQTYYSLTSEATNYNGFANLSIGTEPDQVWGLVLCRGDTNATTCNSCLNVSVQQAPHICPYNKGAIIWYDRCLLCYSYQPFAASTDNSDMYYMWNRSLVMGNKSNFDLLVDTLLHGTNWAAYNSIRNYATGAADSRGEFPRIYSLVQCTPDLHQVQCYQCLLNLIQFKEYILPHLNLTGTQGFRILGVRCNMRYEVYTFYDGEPMITVGSRSVAASNYGGKKKLLLIATTVSLALLSICSLLCFVWIRRRGRRGKKKLPEQRTLNSATDEALAFWSEESSSEFSVFDFTQIADATNQFSTENKLGEGGFGPVYRGQLLDGREIAVKRLASYSGQGLVEFRNEIQLIAKLQHRNLVKLLGWCAQREEKILIYEYMPNKSLDFFVFDSTRAKLLNWSTRFNIIEGVAQGLLYLHKHSRLRIIHRDMKASNILLDCDMIPKISDFGLARIFGSNETEANTMRPVGTYGYMSPEYASEGLFSVKSDVYSYGVLLLEIISGKRNAGFRQYGNYLNLLGYAWELWNESKWVELVDPSLEGEYGENEMVRCINVGLMCVQENAVDRPTMSDVVAMLSSESTSCLPQPKHPAFYNFRIRGEGEEMPAPQDGSVNYVTITDLVVR